MGKTHEKPVLAPRSEIDGRWWRMNCKCQHENGLPCCSLNKDCLIPMMISSPQCDFLLNGCLYYLLLVSADYILEVCRHFEEEIAEFLDYIYTGGDNVKKKEPILLGGYALQEYAKTKAGDAHA